MGGERKYKKVIISLQEGPALSRTRGAPCAGVTAEKRFSRVGLVGFFFPIWRQTTLKPHSTASSQQICYIIPNQPQFSSASPKVTFTRTQQGKPKAKPERHYFSAAVLRKICCSCSNITANLQKSAGSQPFFPGRLAAGVMKPPLILKHRQHIFIFGSAKEKLDQHAASI